MQKIPALFKVRYGQDEKRIARSSNELVPTAKTPQQSSKRLCALLTNVKNYDILYTSTS
jgi:hypothetical protein